MVLLKRRDFLQQGATLVAAGWAVPSFIAETARLIETGATRPSVAHAAGRKVLVLVQLAGGNDGLNTVVPFTDPAYAAARPQADMRIAANQALQLNGSLGLNPNLSRTKSRWDRGQVAIIQGVGYPNHNRSHFRGMDIWETAIPGRFETKGWVGRYLEACGCRRPDSLESLATGTSATPRTFWNEMSLVPAVASLSNFRYAETNYYVDPQVRNWEIQSLRNALGQADAHPEAEFIRSGMNVALTDADILQAAGQAYNPVGSYPNHKFGDAMKLTAQLIAVDVGTSIFYVSIGGFDTHAAQPGMHAGLLRTFDHAVDGFFQDIENVGKLADVTLVTFSEFGRRVAQNGSSGTDHGAAAPMFVMGGSLNSGLHGTHPSLTDLQEGDLKMNVDFRSVYATILEDWLFINSNSILEGAFPQLDLFRGVAPPISCNPRPPITMNTAKLGNGQLRVTLTAGAGTLKSITFNNAAGAQVDVGGGPRGAGFTHTLSPAASQFAFTVQRTSGGHATVHFSVSDDCGAWQSLVGGGPGAF
jgi:uncharacterized protein (DUF1501 family)